MGGGVFGANDVDGGGEIDGAYGFGEGVSGFDEVFVAEGETVVGETFAEAEEAAFGGAGGLIAKLAIADASLVHSLCKLARHAIDIEALKSEEIVIVHVGLLSPPFPERSPT